jgi:hypothetical protein
MFFLERTKWAINRVEKQHGIVKELKVWAKSCVLYNFSIIHKASDFLDIENNPFQASLTRKPTAVQLRDSKYRSINQRFFSP